ncbi:hypothetical protein NHX12_015169 [Muraenolepis orangiensis]|uniref:Pre-SET domain-containing protein n=1 Tax=Muraenolepis orangiensis TaxID=630683 RepID=A0A9Q0D9D7_9TELE|nr:hypothetical protein NHX12_015169 [Muraenolepis orangiensis]
MEEEASSDHVEARWFWEDQDVELVFNRPLSYSHLLVAPPAPPSVGQQEEVRVNQEEVRVIQEEVKISQEEVRVNQEEQEKEEQRVIQEEVSTGPEEASPAQAFYRPHQCSKACLPLMPRSGQPFWGQNPLKVPLLCGFRRLGGTQEVRGTGSDLVYAAPCGLRLRCHDDVLRFLLATESYEVLQVEFFTFNRAVRLDPPLVSLGPRPPELDLSRGLEPAPVELCPGEAGSRPRDFRYRRDRWPHGCFLSAGPALFHTCCSCQDGCLEGCACRGLTSRGTASRGPASRGQHYTHHTLKSPIDSGLFECGPWCGCHRARCQNQLVQRGVRVRLQVFQTPISRGVVLRKGRGQEDAPPPKYLGAEPPSDDDVEVVTEWLAPPVTEGAVPTSSPPLHVPVIQRPPNLNQEAQQNLNQEAQQNHKQEAQQNHTQGTLLNLNQEAQQNHTQEAQQNLNQEAQQNHNQEAQQNLNQEAQQNLNQEPQQNLNQEAQQNHNQKAQQNHNQEAQQNLNQEAQQNLNQEAQQNLNQEAQQNHNQEAQQNHTQEAQNHEGTVVATATADRHREEGNVARFLNHSCRPNLFTQSVFTDTQDPDYPLIAFFTRRSALVHWYTHHQDLVHWYTHHQDLVHWYTHHQDLAGTELTWKYSPDTGSVSPGQEVACQCGHEDCQEGGTLEQAECEDVSRHGETLGDRKRDVWGQEA